MNNHTTIRGFTLVETLVAIAIITLAMIGPIYAVNQSLTTSYVGRDSLVASALAQEGIEYVRAVRDSNYLYNLHTDSNRDWLHGLDGTGGPNCFTAYGCTVDTTPSGSGLAACGSNGCWPVKLSNELSGSPYFYNQQSVSSSNKATIFTRKIVLTNNSAREITVTVTVTFINHNKTYTVTVQDVLDNWL